MKKIILIAAIFSLFCFAALYVMDEYKSNNYLSRSEMAADIDYYFDFLEENHANPYLKYSPEEIRDARHQLKKRCFFPKKPVDFEFEFLRIQQYLDAHTSIMTMHIKPSDKNSHLPDFTFYEDVMLYGTDTVLTLNKVPGKKIAATLEEMISWELHPNIRNERKNLLFKKVVASHMEIQVPYSMTILKNGKKQDTSVKNISVSSTRNSYHQPNFTYEIDRREKIGVFYYNTCSFYDNESQQKFRASVDTFFYQVKQYDIENVFIDVSQNGGGNDSNNNFIYKHLCHEPFECLSIMTGKPDGVKKLCDLSWKIYQDSSWIKSRGELLIRDGKIEIPIKSDGNPGGYAGNVFVIMSNRTFSAAASLCEYLKMGNRTIFVGEDCGQRLPFCGNTLTDNKLPVSGIGFTIPASFSYIEPGIPVRDGFQQPDIYYNLNAPLKIYDFKEIIQQSRSLH